MRSNISPLSLKTLRLQQILQIFSDLHGNKDWRSRLPSCHCRERRQVTVWQVSDRGRGASRHRISNGLPTPSVSPIHQQKCSALACSLACLIYKSGGNRFPPPKAKDILRITTTPILRSTSLGIVPYWDRPFKGVEAKKSERDYSPGLGIVRSPSRRNASFFCSQTSSEVSFSSSWRVRS